MLKGLEDVTRIVQKLSFSRGEADDLLSIRKAILGWNQIFRRLQFEKEELKQKNSNRAIEEWQNMDLLLSHMVDITPLTERIWNAVDAIDFDKKDKIAAGLEIDTDTSEETETFMPFGRPPYGNRWKIKPQ
jgi:DNA mismatch repair ATPase MutS